MKIININIPVAPILIWVELHTGWTFIIDYFVVVGVFGCLWGYFLGKMKWISRLKIIEK